MRLQRFAALGWLGLPLLLAWQLTWGEGPYDAPSIYGRATRTLVEELNEHIGNPMTFPAPLVFRARYHAPAKEFDRVANYGLFFHDFERGRLLGGDRLVFAHPQSEVLMLEGLAEIPQGRRIRRHRPGRLIYPLAWPYVTSVVVELAQPPRQAGCRIELENALFFQHRRMRSRAIALDQVSIEIPAPTGAFDSGLNETRIRSNCTLDLTVLRFVDTSGESDSTMLPHYENDPRFR